MDLELFIGLSRTDIRDWILIVAGILIIVLLVVWLLFTIIIGVAARLLLGTIRSTIKSEVSPLINSMRQSVQNVQGTTAFIGETAVGPIIRVYGIVAGARRMAGSLAGIAGRRKSKP